MIRFATLLALAAALSASPALAYLSQGELTVEALGEGRFEVRARPGLSAPQAWCAAGDYAIHVLNVLPSTRIWRTSEPPRRQREGISFQMSPEGAATRSGLIELGRDDASLSAAAAEALCWGIWSDFRP